MATPDIKKTYKRVEIKFRTPTTSGRKLRDVTNSAKRRIQNLTESSRPTPKRDEKNILNMNSTDSSTDMSSQVRKKLFKYDPRTFDLSVSSFSGVESNATDSLLNATSNNVKRLFQVHTNTEFATEISYKESESSGLNCSQDSHTMAKPRLFAKQKSCSSLASSPPSTLDANHLSYAESQINFTSQSNFSGSEKIRKKTFFSMKKTDNQSLDISFVDTDQSFSSGSASLIPKTMLQKLRENTKKSRNVSMDLSYAESQKSPQEPNTTNHFPDCLPKKRPFVTRAVADSSFCEISYDESVVTTSTIENDLDKTGQGSKIVKKLFRGNSKKDMEDFSYADSEESLINGSLGSDIISRPRPFSSYVPKSLESGFDDVTYSDSVSLTSTVENISEERTSGNDSNSQFGEKLNDEDDLEEIIDTTSPEILKDKTKKDISFEASDVSVSMEKNVSGANSDVVHSELPPNRDSMVCKRSTFNKILSDKTTKDISFESSEASASMVNNFSAANSDVVNSELQPNRDSMVCKRSTFNKILSDKTTKDISFESSEASASMVNNVSAANSDVVHSELPPNRDSMVCKRSTFNKILNDKTMKDISFESSDISASMEKNISAAISDVDSELAFNRGSMLRKRSTFNRIVDDEPMIDISFESSDASTSMEKSVRAANLDVDQTELPSNKNSMDSKRSTFNKNLNDKTMKDISFESSDISVSMDKNISIANSDVDTASGFNIDSSMLRKRSTFNRIVDNGHMKDISFESSDAFTSMEKNVRAANSDVVQIELPSKRDSMVSKSSTFNKILNNKTIKDISFESSEASASMTKHISAANSNVVHSESPPNRDFIVRKRSTFNKNLNDKTMKDISFESSDISASMEKNISAPVSDVVDTESRSNRKSIMSKRSTFNTILNDKTIKDISFESSVESMAIEKNICAANLDLDTELRLNADSMVSKRYTLNEILVDETMKDTSFETPHASIAIEENISVATSDIVDTEILSNRKSAMRKRFTFNRILNNKSIKNISFESSNASIEIEEDIDTNSGIVDTELPSRRDSIVKDMTVDDKDKSVAMEISIIKANSNVNTKLRHNVESIKSKRFAFQKVLYDTTMKDITFEESDAFISTVSDINSDIVDTDSSSSIGSNRSSMHEETSKELSHEACKTASFIEQNDIKRNSVKSEKLSLKEFIVENQGAASSTKSDKYEVDINHQSERKVFDNNLNVYTRKNSIAVSDQAEKYSQESCKTMKRSLFSKSIQDGIMEGISYNESAETEQDDNSITIRMSEENDRSASTVLEVEEQPTPTSKNISHVSRVSYLSVATNSSITDSTLNASMSINAGVPESFLSDGDIHDSRLSGLVATEQGNHQDPIESTCDEISDITEDIKKIAENAKIKFLKRKNRRQELMCLMQKKPRNEKIIPNSRTPKAKRSLQGTIQRFRPAPWASRRLYKHLEDRLLPEFGIEYVLQAENIVKTMNSSILKVEKSKTYQKAAVDDLKKTLANFKIIETTFDFYKFIREYLPPTYVSKVIPSVQPFTNIVFPPVDGSRRDNDPII